MQVFDVVPQISARALKTEVDNANIDDDETTGRRTRLKRRAPSGDMQLQNQGHPAASEYGVVVVSMIYLLLNFGTHRTWLNSDFFLGGG